MRTALDCSKSLHELKDEFRKRYMGEQCRQLLVGLDSAIRATTERAPARSQLYVLNRTGHAQGVVTRPEDTLERAVWEQWNKQDAEPVPHAWHRILSYQMPLQGTRGDTKWGKIDAVGTTERGLPIIVELKCGTNASDTPAKMLVQAAAYAIAVRKAWEPHLKDQWAKEVARYPSIEISMELTTVPIVCAAPPDFWRNWIGDTDRARTLSDEDWQSFLDLAAALSARGFPATLLEIGPEARQVGEPLTARVIPFARRELVSIPRPR